MTSYVDAKNFPKDRAQVISAIEAALNEPGCGIVVVSKSTIPPSIHQKLQNIFQVVTSPKLGRSRYGWKSKGVVDIGEAEVITEILKLRAHGVSMAKTMHTLNQRGITNRSGGPWMPQYIARIIKRAEVDSPWCQCAMMKEVTARAGGKTDRHLPTCSWYQKPK